MGNFFLRHPVRIFRAGILRYVNAARMLEFISDASRSAVRILMRRFFKVSLK